MFNQLLPPRIDNAYRGHKLALWLFALVVVFRIAQSLVVIFGGSSIVISADGIPLDTFTQAGAQTVVALWTLLGITRLLIFLMCVLTLLRYRSAIPFMFALLLLYYLAAQLSLQLVPVVRAGTPPGPIANVVLLSLTLVGLALSLWRRSDDRADRAVRTGAT
jgi:hypothetical protein